MGAVNSSRSGNKEYQSDETVKPLWDRVATYLGELFGIRQTVPLVFSSTSDTIGIGRPLYTDRIKRMWPRESVNKNRDDDNGGGDDEWVNIKEKAVPDENSVSVATRRHPPPEHRRGRELPGPGDILEKLRRRGVPIIQCCKTPRPLPPPPGQEADIANSTDSTCSSLSAPDTATRKDRPLPSESETATAEEQPEMNYPGSGTHSGHESMARNSENAEVAASAPRGDVPSAQCKDHRRRPRQNAVNPENQVQYSFQDLRHWNKKLVLTAAGSRVDWSAQREQHARQLQRCDDPRLKKPAVINSAETASGSANDTFGNTSACDNLDTNEDIGGRHQRPLSLPSSFDHIEDTGQIRQDTRSELLPCRLDEKHRTCGTVSESVLPGARCHQRTYDSRRHPIVSNILLMLGADTKIGDLSGVDHIVGKAGQTLRNPEYNKHEDKPYTSTSHGKSGLETNLFETNSSQLQKPANNSLIREDVIARHRQSDLHSTSFVQATTHSSVPETVYRSPVSAMYARGGTPPNTTDDRAQRATGDRIRQQRRNLPMYIGRESTADWVRSLLSTHITLNAR